MNAYPYVGNGSFCFTNSLRMSLLAAGMHEAPETNFIECLTGMPFGTFYIRPEKVLFPSGAGIEPDMGLTLAIQIMGWASEEAYGGSPDEALARLREGLRSGPVLIGPVDMGYLSYVPWHGSLGGVDHFVVALGMTDTDLRLHDPAGFAYTTLPVEDFLAAWQAERINYGRKPYMMRWGFRQVEPVSRAGMITRALAALGERLRKDWSHPAIVHSGAALCAAADELRGDASPTLTGILTGFTLPLSAGRLNYAAAFLSEAGLDEASSTAHEEAVLFGEMQLPASLGQWHTVASLLDRAAPVEDRLMGLLRGMG